MGWCRGATKSRLQTEIASIGELFLVESDAKGRAD